MILRNLSWKLISQNSSIQNFSFKMKNSKRLRQDLTKWSTSLSTSNSCQISFQTNISLIRVCFAVKRSCTMEKKYILIFCVAHHFIIRYNYMLHFFSRKRKNELIFLDWKDFDFSEILFSPVNLEIVKREIPSLDKQILKVEQAES